MSLSIRLFEIPMFYTEWWLWNVLGILFRNVFMVTKTWHVRPPINLIWITLTLIISAHYTNHLILLPNAHVGVTIILQLELRIRWYGLLENRSTWLWIQSLYTNIRYTSVVRKLNWWTWSSAIARVGN